MDIYVVMSTPNGALATTCLTAWQQLKEAVKSTGHRPVMELTTAIPVSLRRQLAASLARTHELGPVGTVTDLSRANEILTQFPEVKTIVTPNFNPAVIEAAKDLQVIPGVTNEAEIQAAAKYSNVPMLKIFPALYTSHEDFFDLIKTPMAKELKMLEARGCMIHSQHASHHDMQYSSHTIDSPSALYKLAHNEDFKRRDIVVQMPNNQPRDVAELNKLIELSHRLGKKALVSGIEVPALLVALHLAKIFALSKADAIALGPSAFDADDLAYERTAKITARALHLGEAIRAAQALSAHLREEPDTTARACAEPVLL